MNRMPDNQRTVLQAALAIESAAEALDALSELAAVYLENNKTDLAANLLAFVLDHPRTEPDTHDRAETLWFDLETYVCPRLLWDAREWAHKMRLEQVVELVLSGRN